LKTSNKLHLQDRIEKKQCAAKTPETIKTIMLQQLLKRMKNWNFQILIC